MTWIELGSVVFGIGLRIFVLTVIGIVCNGSKVPPRSATPNSEAMSSLVQLFIYRDVLQNDDDVYIHHPWCLLVVCWRFDILSLSPYPATFFLIRYLAPVHFSLLFNFLFYIFHPIKSSKRPWSFSRFSWRMAVLFVEHTHKSVLFSLLSVFVLSIFLMPVCHKILLFFLFLLLRFNHKIINNFDSFLDEHSLAKSLNFFWCSWCNPNFVIAPIKSLTNVGPEAISGKTRGRF